MTWLEFPASHTPVALETHLFLKLTPEVKTDSAIIHLGINIGYLGTNFFMWVCSVTPCACLYIQYLI